MIPILFIAKVVNRERKLKNVLYLKLHIYYFYCKNMLQTSFNLLKYLLLDFQTYRKNKILSFNQLSTQFKSAVNIIENAIYQRILVKCASELSQMK